MGSGEVLRTTIVCRRLFVKTAGKLPFVFVESPTKTDFRTNTGHLNVSDATDADSHGKQSTKLRCVASDRLMETKCQSLSGSGRLIRRNCPTSEPVQVNNSFLHTKQMKALSFSDRPGF